MAFGTDPGFYKRLYSVSVNAGAVTACTTRAPTAVASLAAANILPFVPTTGNTDGRVIEKIIAKASSTSMTAPTTAMTITFWRNDVTTAFPIAEMEIDVVTPSTTAKSKEAISTFDFIRLAATESLYYSLSVTTTASTNALTLTGVGGDL
jgi:hypothetical protein